MKGNIYTEFDGRLAYRRTAAVQTAKEAVNAIKSMAATAGAETNSRRWILVAQAVERSGRELVADSLVDYRKAAAHWPVSGRRLRERLSSSIEVYVQDLLAFSDPGRGMRAGDPIPVLDTQLQQVEERLLEELRQGVGRFGDAAPTWFDVHPLLTKTITHGLVFVLGIVSALIVKKLGG